MDSSKLRTYSKYICYVLIVILLYVIWSASSCPYCGEPSVSERFWQVITPGSSASKVADQQKQQAEFNNFLLQPERMPYTTEQASGIPVNDIQAQKIYTYLKPKDYVLNDTYGLGGADESIRLVQDAFETRQEARNPPNFVARSGFVDNVPGAVDDLRIIETNKLNRIE